MCFFFSFALSFFLCCVDNWKVIVNSSFHEKNKTILHIERHQVGWPPAPKERHGNGLLVLDSCGFRGWAAMRRETGGNCCCLACVQHNIWESGFLLCLANQISYERPPPCILTFYYFIQTRWTLADTEHLSWNDPDTIRQGGNEWRVGHFLLPPPTLDVCCAGLHHQLYFFVLLHSSNHHKQSSHASLVDEFVSQCRSLLDSLLQGNPIRVNDIRKSS